MILTVFDIPVHADKDFRLSDFEQFLTTSKLSNEQRAGLLLLSLRGRYPTPEEFEPVVKSLSQGNWRRAAVLASRLIQVEPRIALVPLESNLIDVTRYSAQRRISGIPRVVKNLVFSEPFDDSVPLVWESGIPGFGTRGKEGRIEFSKRHWMRGHNRKGTLISLYLKVSSAVGGTRAGIWLLKQLSTRFLPAIYRFIGRPRRPKVAALLLNQNYFLPEVPDYEVSTRLTVWKKAFPEMNLTVIVHDLLPISHPEYFSPASNREHLFYVRMLARANCIFVATHSLANSTRDLLTLHSSETADVRVLPLPITNFIEEDSATNPLPSYPFFIFFGGFEKRKGLSDLVDYLESRPLEEIPFRIVILGAPWPEQGAEVWVTAQRVLRLRSIFQVVGSLSDSSLRGLMSQALGVLYLSHAEGYGLPIIESLAFGKVVLTQSTPTNSELAERHGGVWSHFSFDDNRGFEALTALANTHDPFGVINVRAPDKDSIPNSVTHWARQIHDWRQN